MRRLICLAMLLPGSALAQSYSTSDSPIARSDNPGDTRPRVSLNLNRVATPTVMAGLDENPSNIAQQASCVVQISGGEDLYQQQRNDAGTAAALLASSLVQDRAAREALNLDPQQRQAALSMGAFPSGDRTAMLIVVLRKTDTTYPPDSANKVMRAAVDALRNALAQQYAVQNHALTEQIDAQQASLAKLQSQEAALRQQLSDARKKTQDFSAGYNGYDVSNIESNLRSQRRNIMQELLRYRAQLAALRPTSAPAQSEWADVVAIREQRVADLRKQVEAGQAEASTLSDEQAKLAEAKAKLADAKSSASGNRNDANYRDQQAQNLQSQIDQQEALLKPIDDQLAQLDDPDFQKALSNIAGYLQQEQQLRNNINQLGAQITTLQMRSPISAPTVTILGEPTTLP